MSNQADVIGEIGEPETDDVVRRLFTLQGFMPLPLTVTSDWGEGVGVHRSKDDYAAQAIIYDHELAPAALRNGESQRGVIETLHPRFRLASSPSGFILTPKRTEQIIDGWVGIFARKAVHEFAKVSCRSASTFHRMFSVEPKLRIIPSFMGSKVLKVDGVVGVSRDYATQVFADTTSQEASDVAVEKKHAKRHLLKFLNKQPALPFRLADVIEGFSDAMQA